MRRSWSRSKASWPAPGKGAAAWSLVGGEAGIGKTSLIAAFCRPARRRCPGPVGRLRRAADPAAAGPAARHRPRGRRGAGRRGRRRADRHRLFSAFLDLLDSAGPPVVAVVEDAHWADEATLDLLVFARPPRGRHAGDGRRHLPRRRGRARAPPADGPRRPGHAPRGAPPRASAADQAGRGRRWPGTGADRPGPRSTGTTGGNPFFVTEVLDAASGRRAADRPRRRAGPRRQALAGGPGRCSTPPRSCPTQVELELAGGGAPAPVPRPSTSAWPAGMLRDDGRGLRFRHELARLAVEEAVPAARRVELHRRVLAYLDPGRRRAGAAGLPCRGGGRRPQPCWSTPRSPRSAAAALGAHREAAGHYAIALRFADGLASRRQAELLEAYAVECGHSDRVAEAIDASERALADLAPRGRPRAGGRAAGAPLLFLWAAAAAPRRSSRRPRRCPCWRPPGRAGPGRRLRLAGPSDAGPRHPRRDRGRPARHRARRALRPARAARPGAERGRLDPVVRTPTRRS